MNAPQSKVPVPTSEPLTAALRALLGELVREAVLDAVAELREAEQPRPVLLTSEQLGQTLGCSRATVSRLVHDGCPRIFVGDSPRYEMPVVLDWLRARSEARRNDAGEPSP